MIASAATNGKADPAKESANGRPVQPVQEACERKVFGDDQCKSARRGEQCDGYREPAPAICLGNCSARNSRVTELVRHACERDSRDQEDDADGGDGSDESALHRPTSASNLGSEVERQARADEQKCSASARTPRVVQRRLRRERRTRVFELEAGENEHGDKLCQGEYSEADEDPAERGEDDQNERDWQYELERAAVGGNAGELRRQQVVDDERHRVRQIEKVRERPDPAVRDGDPPSGRFLNEGAQTAGGDDSARIGDPDAERGGKDEERQRNDEPRGIEAVARSSGQERQERDRAADRGDREADEERGGYGPLANPVSADARSEGR